MSLSFVQNYPDPRLKSYQRNKDHGKFLLEQLETKKRISEEEEKNAQKRNLDPLQTHQYMPWETNRSLISPNKINFDDDTNEVRKFMIEAYGTGKKISDEENQMILRYFQSLTPAEKDHLIKQIKACQQYNSMKVAMNSSPISLPRKSLLEIHKKDEFDILESSDTNTLKSFPVGNEKYFISDRDLYMNEQEKKTKYRDELHQNSTLSPIAHTKMIMNKHSDLGKSKGYISFDHVRDTNLMKSNTSLHYAELYNTLSLPQAYRNKIGKMECYK